MKVYVLKNNDILLICDYIEKNSNIDHYQKKFIYNVLKYLYKKNSDSFTVCKVNNNKIFVESFIVDFVNLYDVFISELIENNILIEKE